MDDDPREQADRIAGMLDAILIETKRGNELLTKILAKVDDVDAAVMMDR